MENKNEYLNNRGLSTFTAQFKEWIYKLFRRVHARIGHVEEDLYHTRKELLKKVNMDYQLTQKVSQSGDMEYVLMETTTKTEHGSIVIDVEGDLNVFTWEEEVTIKPEDIISE